MPYSIFPNETELKIEQLNEKASLTFQFGLLRCESAWMNQGWAFK